MTRTKSTAGAAPDESEVLQARPVRVRRRKPDGGTATASGVFSSVTYERILRTLFCVVAIAMSAGGAMVWDASRATASALQAAHGAMQNEDESARVVDLVSATHVIESAWSRPGAWHAGAQEALSWTYAALDAQAANDDFLELSILNAERTVSRAPIQPAPWTRLAVFDLDGTPNGWCRADECLAMSWLAVELAPLPNYCARLQLAHELGLGGGADDPRVQVLTRLPLTADTLGQCLSYMSQQQRLQALLQQHWQSTERTRAEQR
ncbi:MAG TPA: hypothetical protein VM915_13665 [Verrucomicrobiae bacterium]|nr:hypothetical protein [Verrucomicrobiae bacterium]